MLSRHPWPSSGRREVSNLPLMAVVGRSKVKSGAPRGSMTACSITFILDCHDADKLLVGRCMQRKSVTSHQGEKGEKGTHSADR